MRLEIGAPYKGASCDVADLAEASAKWRDLVVREDLTVSGATGSLAPKAKVMDGKKVVGYVSYNGRIWAGPYWKGKPSDHKCLYPAE